MPTSIQYANAFGDHRDPAVRHRLQGLIVRRRSVSPRAGKPEKAKQMSVGTLQFIPGNWHPIASVRLNALMAALPAPCKRPLTRSSMRIKSALRRRRLRRRFI